MLGKYLQSLNSVEYIANQFFQTSDLKGNLFELPEIIDSITLENLKKFAEEFLQKENSTVFYLLPKGKNSSKKLHRKKKHMMLRPCPASDD